MSDRKYIRCKHCNCTGIEPGCVATADNGHWLCACCHGRGWITLQRETMFNRLTAGVTCRTHTTEAGRT